MGITLQAMVEVFDNVHYHAVSTWEFNKDYSLMLWLTESALNKGHPPRPSYDLARIINEDSFFGFKYTDNSGHLTGYEDSVTLSSLVASLKAFEFIKMPYRVIFYEI